jgi:UDP-N-acetylmuramoyl-tripeptide--D-alanyl-D-alanine ligase
MTEIIWTKQDAMTATSGVATEGWAGGNIVIDTRKIKEGDTFIAIRGASVDGHNFINHAVSSGAISIIAEREVGDDVPTLLVQDSTQAIFDLALYRRKQIVGTKVIGITGSAGKTSTKEMMYMVLADQAKTHLSFGNYNNHLGVPISIASTPIDSKYAVFEMGMNHAGEILELTKQVKPDVAIITTIAAAHLEFFDSMESIARAKAEIFAGLSGSGCAIINADNPYYDILLAESKKYGVKNILGFGKKEEAKAKLVSCTTSYPFKIVADIMGELIEYELNVLGMHHVYNSLAVLLATKLIGADLKVAATKLYDFTEVQGRGSAYSVHYKGKSFKVIDDSYNANPASVAAALQVLGRHQAGRRVAILGDMLELGHMSNSIHADLRSEVLNNNIDKIVTVGTHMKYLYDALPSSYRLGHFESVEQLMFEVDDIIMDEDVTLVKASRGTRLYQIVERFKNVI